MNIVQKTADQIFILKIVKNAILVIILMDNIIILIMKLQLHAEDFPIYVQLILFIKRILMAQINVFLRVDLIIMKWEIIVFLIVLGVIEKKLIHQLKNANVDIYIISQAIILFVWMKINIVNQIIILIIWIQDYVQM